METPKQIILVETDPGQFERKVQQHLDRGWKVILGTLQTAMSSNVPDGFTYPRTSYLLTVVLQQTNNAE